MNLRVSDFRFVNIYFIPCTTKFVARLLALLCKAYYRIYHSSIDVLHKSHRNRMEGNKDQ